MFKMLSSFDAPDPNADPVYVVRLIHIESGAYVQLDGRVDSDGQPVFDIGIRDTQTGELYPWETISPAPDDGSEQARFNEDEGYAQFPVNSEDGETFALAS